MTERFSCNYRVLIISLLILLCFSSISYAFQTKISGTLNTVNARIETISGTNKIIVNDVTGFGANDTVLVIQMQGVQIQLAPTYGTPQGQYGTPGKYEFLIIQSVNGGTKEIVFYRDMLNAYDTRGTIQILKVPSYNSVEVTGGSLTCSQWDSSKGTGGVLAMIVGKTLKLTSNIDVSGKGFSGGGNRIGTGICYNTNTVLYGAQYYDSTNTNAGFKGEGVGNYTEFFQPVMPGYTKGQGPSWTGGGGGNARFSGGGGGSNRGSGGQGGLEDCALFPLNGGSGGFIANHASLVDRIYMGGGGGASTSFLAALTSGGNGGGIVIIVSDTIIGSGGKIISNGGAGGNATSVNSGSGGGGAGGSIALSVNSYGSASLGFSIVGGKGGDNIGTNIGEGGGGGGGLLWISTNTTGNVTNLLNGGLPGNSASSSAYPGTIGEKRLGFKAILNGFLFNSVRSSVTGDQIDSICSNVIPRRISGTLPVGGTGPYTYKWEKSYDKIGWTTLYNGPDSVNYSPNVLESTTVYFRRTITDSSTPTALTDISLPVEIIVQTAITGNSVGKDTIICYNQKPLGLVQSSGVTLANGNGKYQYKWLQNITNSNWDTSPAASGTYTNPGYNPPNLLTSTFYQRFVTSGRCIDHSNSVTITVLPSITGNTITRSDSVICEGYKFVPLNASAVGGGNGTFYYKWQDSTSVSANYLPAVGTNNSTSYSVDTSTFSVIEKRYLRRVVFSGPDSVCRSNSLPILLTRYHKLKSNLIISADTTIGYDTVPHIIRARKMISGDGGDGTYSYVWRSKTTIWGTAPPVFNLQNYSPDSLKITTQYRRVVNSSVCTDTSSFITVTVQSKILGNSIFLSPSGVEDTICYGLAPVIIKGNPPSGGSTVPFDYSYKWYRSRNSNGPWSEIVGKTDSVYQPDTLHATTYFRRYVSSPKVSPRSIDKSNLIKITVLPLITNKDISPLTQAICSGSPITPINSSGATAGGDGSYRYTWRQDSANTGWKNIPGYIKILPPGYSKPSIKDPFRYIRYIYSGSNDCCSDSSNTVSISINPLPTGNITPATDRICEGSQVSLGVNLTGKKPWNIKYTESASTGSSQVSPPAITSAVSTIFRIPPVISSDSLAYSYTLFSVQDSNLCLAASLTVGLRKSTVYKYPDSHLNASFSADSICGHTYGKPMVTKKSRGSGIWTKTSGAGTATFFPDANTWNASVTADSTSAPWLPRNLYNFKWKEVNWQCADSASVKIIFNKGTGSAHPGKSADLYSFFTSGYFKI